MKPISTAFILVVLWLSMCSLRPVDGQNVTQTNQPAGAESADRTELNGLHNEIQKLKDNQDAKDKQDALWLKLLSPAVALISVIVAIISAFVAFNTPRKIFIQHAQQKEERERAVDLLNQFLTDEFYVKARLISQEYLVEDGAKYDRSIHRDGRKKNFVELSNDLAASKDKGDNEARFFIRAIPSFFWLVDQAHSKKLLKDNEELFEWHYGWYWVHIISERIKTCPDGRMFQKFDWMTKPEIEKKIEEEYKQLRHRVATAPPSRQLGTSPQIDDHSPPAA